ncbi:hypothetical protein D9758_007859 [Tetrapyrgos nigripes]|uniref:Uncharacterized protein n=1 Tax=Tetrapyrgos nigripes TaxID=182062 RepID=A0A8H5CYB3_9AGAR|nr:hypothetical protein D9758_007859 [Tetrapyrgos nigripes]
MRASAVFFSFASVVLAAPASQKGQQGALGNLPNSKGTNGAANFQSADDAQSSLTLDPRVIATGFANDGQEVQEAGQVASLTSTNNFINFCLTQPNLPITNGKQIETGSCNPAPMGVLPSSDNMPSSKFIFPKNGVVLQTGEIFTITMAVRNIELGNFVNAQENYFAAPQHLNDQGQIIGHTHVTIDFLGSINDTQPTNPKKFAYFKGVNTPAKDGVASVTVDEGLPAGFYRLASINAAANHQPVLVPIAQHGSLDDMVYFTVADDPFSVPAGFPGEDNGASTANGTTNTQGNNAQTGTAVGNTGNTATTTGQQGQKGGQSQQGQQQQGGQSQQGQQQQGGQSQQGQQQQGGQSQQGQGQKSQQGQNNQQPQTQGPSNQQGGFGGFGGFHFPDLGKIFGF